MNRDEMLREYTRCYQNILSSSAERRIAELDAEAAREGLRFQMLNETAWMNPHALVTPRFVLIPT